MLKIVSFFKNLGLSKIIFILLCLLLAYFYYSNNKLDKEIKTLQENNLQLIQVNKNNTNELNKLKEYYENTQRELITNEKEKSKIKTNINEIKSRVKNISSKELIGEFNIVLSELFDTKNNNSK